MDLADAVTAIQDAMAPRQPIVVSINGDQYAAIPTSNDAYELIEDPRPYPDPSPKVATLALGTLAGFVDFIAANIDGLSLAQHLVAVADPLTVALLSELHGSHVERSREMVRDAVAVAQAPACGWKFGAQYTQEEFIIGVLTSFEATTEMEALLNLVGNVRSEVVKSGEDDGVSQTVVGRVGVTLNAPIEVKAIWRLAPYRTFREVDQPVSSFLLRVYRQGPDELPKFALHEADGAAWKIEAVTRVAVWLREKLTDKVVVLS